MPFFYFTYNRYKTDCGTNNPFGFASNSQQNPAMQKGHPRDVPFGFSESGGGSWLLLPPSRIIHHEITGAGRTLCTAAPRKRGQLSEGTADLTDLSARHEAGYSRQDCAVSRLCPFNFHVEIQRGTALSHCLQS